MRPNGITLIELMVTLALIALFSTMALPLAELTVKRNHESELRSSLRQIREALDAYKQAADDGRVLVRVGDSGYPKSLSILVEGVEDAKSPTRTPIHFLRRIPRDPLADTSLKAEASWGERSYKSSYDAPRAGDDVYDIYSLSAETGINGIPYREW